MTILLCEGFDHYDGCSLVGFAKAPFPKDNDSYGFSFKAEDGRTVKVNVDRQENGMWRMVIDDLVEMSFSERPLILANLL